jgi:uncharacterized protein (DUF433 family)
MSLFLTESEDLDKARKKELLDSIERRAETFGGKPVVRQTRVKVETILYDIGNGEGLKALLHNYPALREEDVSACLLYAAQNSAPNPDPRLDFILHAFARGQWHDDIIRQDPSVMPADIRSSLVWAAEHLK